MAEAKQEKTVSRSAMLAALNKKRPALAKGAKEPRRPGYMDDAAILMKLGIGEKERKTFPARLSKVEFSFAKDDTNRPAFRFYYMIESDDPKANGTIVNNYYILEEKSKRDTGEVWQTLEESAAEIMGEFANIGEDPTEWSDPIATAVDVAERLTKEKPPVMLTVSGYRKGNGELGMNKTPSPVADNSDLEYTEEDDTVQDTTGEAPFTTDEAASEDDPSVWVGYWIEFEHETVEGTVRMKVNAYDEASGTFSGVDENNEAWEGDYAIPVDHPFVQSENQND